MILPCFIENDFFTAQMHLKYNLNIPYPKNPFLLFLQFCQCKLKAVGFDIKKIIVQTTAMVVYYENF